MRGNLKMKFKMEDTDLTDFLFCVYDLSILPQDFVQSYLYLDHIERFNMKVSYGCSISKKEKDYCMP